MFDSNKVNITLPGSKKQIVYRTEKLQDELKGIKIASQGLEDKNDRMALLMILAKVKMFLGVESVDGVRVNVSNYSDFESLVENITQYPQDGKVIEALYTQMNGDAEEADTYVKNLLKAKAS